MVICDAVASDRAAVTPSPGLRAPQADGMWRFLLLRVLPRRLVPLLVLFELVQLVRRLRARNERIIEGHATEIPTRPTKPTAIEPRAIDRGPSTAR
jgi:hypothetical protein